MSTRGDRIAMQASDDGEPDEMVWVTGFQGTHYHDDSDCVQLAGSDPDDVTREKAQRRWLAPCSKCVLSRGEFR